MVLAVGSMMVKGVFKAGSLLTGIGKTKSGLKGAEMAGKSTVTEMKRMTKQSHLLSKGLALIGVAGFTSLLMQTPQLSGALMKIKTEMMLIAYSIGKHLKPALDSVATILNGIRQGDWTIIKQGVSDLVSSLLELAAKAGTFVVDVIFGEGTGAKLESDFNNWIKNLKTAWEEGNLGALIATTFWDPIKWVFDKLVVFFAELRIWLIDAGRNFRESLDAKGLGKTLREVPVLGKAMQFAGFDRAVAQNEANRAKAIETQNNTINIDASNIHGDISDPTILSRFFNLIQESLVKNQQSGTY